MTDLVTPASWKFFSILGISPEFLSFSVQQWSDNEIYNEAKKILRHFKVTNESAERSVKLSAEFLGLAKKEDNF